MAETIMIRFENYGDTWTVEQVYGDGSSLSYGAEDTFEAALIQYLAHNGYITPLVQRMETEDVNTLATILDGLFHVIHCTAMRMFEVMYVKEGE